MKGRGSGKSVAFRCSDPDWHHFFRERGFSAQPKPVQGDGIPPREGRRGAAVRGLPLFGEVDNLVGKPIVAGARPFPGVVSVTLCMAQKPSSWAPPYKKETK